MSCVECRLVEVLISVGNWNFILILNSGKFSALENAKNYQKIEIYWSKIPSEAINTIFYSSSMLHQLFAYTYSTLWLCMPQLLIACYLPSVYILAERTVFQLLLIFIVIVYSLLACVVGCHENSSHSFPTYPSILIPLSFVSLAFIWDF